MQVSCSPQNTQTGFEKLRSRAESIKTKNMVFISKVDGAKTQSQDVTSSWYAGVLVNCNKGVDECMTAMDQISGMGEMDEKTIVAANRK
jgi:hypothetical protein